MKTILENILGDVNREVKGGHIPSEIKPHVRLSFPPGITNSEHPRAVYPDSGRTLETPKWYKTNFPALKPTESEHCR